LGAALAQTVFDAGLRRAQKEQAIAAYDTTVADYRQTILTAFQDVEDNLATLRVLEQEATVQDEAVKAARDGSEKTRPPIFMRATNSEPYCSRPTLLGQRRP